MHLLNKRASTFPLTTTNSEPNPHHYPGHQHHHHHHHHHHQQLHALTTTLSATDPRASSEHDIYYSSAATTTACTPRTSCSDEAQACFNLLLILRADTQHLISLRNDNLDALEGTGPARPLLQSINDALAAAAQSIAELGPFLERHRWPVYDPAAAARTGFRANVGEDASPQQRRSLASYSLIRPVFLLRRSKGTTTATATATATAAATTPTPTTKRRRRCKSLSNSTGTTVAGATPSPPGWEEEAVWLSPERLFSWTLELTAQHTAALVALDRLERFLAYGVAALREEEEEAGREASAQETEEEAARRRASWWEQQRGEFENVGLIQSLMTGPRRRRPSGGRGATSSFISAAEAAVTTAAAEAGKEGKQRFDGNDGAASDLRSISEQQDDGRSMTIDSEPPSELSMPATPHWGLTARPRVPPQALRSGDDEEPIRTRRVMTEPVSFSSHPSTQPPEPRFDNPPMSSRSDTFGQPDEMQKPSTSVTLPLSRFNSLRQRPRIATQPFPPLVGFPTLVPLERRNTTSQGIATTANNSNNNNNIYLALPQHRQAGGGISPAPALSATTPALSPLLFTPSGDGHQVSPASPSPSPSPSPGVETPYTPYTPYTPLDQQLAHLFAQKALPSKGKTIQPVIRELEDMVVSPVESHMVAVSFMEHGVSPITTTTSTTGGHHQLPSPRKGSLVSQLSSSAAAAAAATAETAWQSHQQQQSAPVSPHAVKAAAAEEDEDDNDKHWPYLAYMARKQAVATSRWSLRRSRTTARNSG